MVLIYPKSIQTRNVSPGVKNLKSFSQKESFLRHFSELFLRTLSSEILNFTICLCYSVPSANKHTLTSLNCHGSFNNISFSILWHQQETFDLRCFLLKDKAMDWQDHNLFQIYFKAASKIFVALYISMYQVLIPQRSASGTVLWLWDCSILPWLHGIGLPAFFVDCSEPDEKTKNSY